MINFSFLTIASTLAFYIAMDVQDKRGGERERGGGGVRGCQECIKQ